MSYLYYITAAVASVAQAVVPVLPNAANIGVTDFAGTVTQDASKISLVRAITDINGYAYCAPGARIRLGVSCAQRNSFVIRLRYTGLVTRLDSYNPIGSVYVDGVLAQDFTGPASWTIQQPHPTGDVAVSITLEAGTRTVEVILPYLASVDVIGFTRAAEASIVAPIARTSQKVVFLGDSIEHGFNSSKMRAHWTFLLAEAKGWQHIDLGYGGRDLRPADFPIAAAVGAQRTITNYGINDGFQGTTQANMQSKAQTALTNFRSAAGTQALYWINIFDCTRSDLLTPAATLRTAISNAFTSTGGPYDFLIPGGTANGLPASIAFPDGIHPDDADSALIASVIGGLV